MAGGDDRTVSEPNRTVLFGLAGNQSRGLMRRRLREVEEVSFLIFVRGAVVSR